MSPRLRDGLIRAAARRDGWGRVVTHALALCVDCGGLHDMSDQACPRCAASTDVSIAIKRVELGHVLCLDCMRPRPKSHACPDCGSDQWAAPYEVAS